MKQTTIKLLCAGLMMTAAACSSDPETENVAPQGERAQMSFTATSAETRTELVDKTKVHWQAGDEIAVFRQESNKVYFDNNFTTAESGPAVTFTGEATANAEKYVALYPSSAHVGTLNNQQIILNMPDIQNATAGSFDPAANISLAESTDGETLRFENLFGLVKFSRPTTSNRNIVQATLHGNNGEILIASGIQFPGKTLVYDTEYNEDKIVLQGEIATGTDYYFVVRPVVLTKGFYITFLDKDGTEYSVTGTNPASIKAGYILNLGELDPEAVKTDFDYDYATNTFTVYTETGLRNWAEAVRMESAEINGKTVDMTATNCILEADIALTKEWESVGYGSFNEDGLAYTGTFDGKGHTISGLKLTGATFAGLGNAPYAGFFGRLNGATVRNVTFDRPSVTDGSAGVIAGYAKGNTVIENCHARNATVTGKSEARSAVHNTGGLIAQAETDNETEVSISNCTITGTITSQKVTATIGNIPNCSGPVGGIVGRAKGKITISGCHFDGKLTSEYSAKSNYCYVGGIIGAIESGSGSSVEGCTANMTAKAKYYTGGILGYARATVTVSGSASSGTLTTDADKYCGGLVGYYRNETTGSYSTCRSTSAQAGGLFGYYMGAAYHHVTACFTDNTQIDAINGFSDNTLTAEEANATMRVDNIADKKDEMNGAIAAAGWQFVENDGTITVGSETFALDRTAFPLKPVKTN